MQVYEILSDGHENRCRTRQRPRSGLGFAPVRRLCALLACAVVTAGLCTAALAAGRAPTRSTCTIAPKKAWTVCPHANLSGRKLAHADLRNANLARADLTGATLTFANLASAD